MIEDGRLYGRGSCDTKAGMATAIEALERVTRSGTLRRNVILVGESDEELGSIGARDTLRHLAGRDIDWAIATEPTELRVVTHHKGIAIAKLVASGRAGHSSAPEKGSNAIYALARAVGALEALNAELAERRDPVLGSPTLSVGVIQGGAAPNIIPDRAWLLCDRRLVPGDSEASVLLPGQVLRPGEISRSPGRQGQEPPGHTLRPHLEMGQRHTAAVPTVDAPDLCVECSETCTQEFVSSASRTHVTGGVDYNDTPPTGGDHDGCWEAWGASVNWA